MESADRLIGNAVTKFRGERSQADIAAQMRQRGWRWSQATVWSVEKGERPLRLAEADDLARVLGCLLADLTRTETQARMLVALADLARARDELERAIDVHAGALDEVAEAADAEAPLDDDLDGAVRRMLDGTAHRVVEMHEPAVGPPQDFGPEGSYVRYLWKHRG